MATRLPDALPAGREYVTIEVPPLVTESSTVAAMSDAAVALAANVSTDVVTAVRAGIAYWRIVEVGVPARLAAALGVTESELRAGFKRAMDRQYGRGAESFASSSSWPNWEPTS